MHTFSNSVLSLYIQWCVVPVLGYLSQDILWHSTLEQGCTRLLCGLPTQNHGDEVLQKAIGGFCDYVPDTADNYRYCPCGI